MSVEPRRIRKLPKDPFPAIPAGRSRRGVVTSQEVTPIRRLHTAVSRPRSIEGFVTLTQLALERGIQAQLARLWVKNSGAKKPTAGWRWAEGSKELKRIRQTLGLPT